MSDHRVRFAILLIAAAMLVFSAMDQLAYAVAFYAQADYGAAIGSALAILGRFVVAWSLVEIARDQ